MNHYFSPRIIRLLAFCCAFSAASALTGQIDLDKKIEEYLKKGERKVEQRVDREVDKKINEGVDEVFEKKPKKEKKKKKSKKGEETAGQVETPAAPPPPKYYKLEETTDITRNDFIGSFVMKVEVSRDGSSTPAVSETRTLHFAEKATAVQITSSAGEPATVIYDLEKNTMTTVKQGAGGKVAIILKKPVSKRIALTSENIKTTALSSTKLIEGQQCAKFLVETPDDFITIWVASGLEYNYDLLMRSSNTQQSSIQNLLKVSSNYGILGLPMEMVIESKINNEIVQMNLSALKIGVVDAAVFDITGADVTDMTEY
ncbi:MAG: DUF4412 domain-containing protein [Saprospirales bacterium]|nr:DUF4412 domain-containing protein [Saprospirales bacterium]